MNKMGTDVLIEPRIKLIPFNDVKLGTARRYLVKGLVPRVGLVVIWGPPKSGKSFWTFDLAMHVALGWEYRGRRVQQGPVIYAAFEGASGLETRIEAFRQKRLPTIPAHIPFYLEPVTLDLVADHGELITAIRRQVREEDGPPAAVVLDTLNRSLRGSESSDEDMGAYVKAADVIREAFQCAVIVVHHCGIAADRPRGHTSLSGAVDAQLSVKRNADDVILVSVELMKDGPQGEVLASKLEAVDVGKDEDGDTITSCVVTETDTPETKSRSKLDAASKIALELLTRAIGDGGENRLAVVDGGAA